MKVQLATIEQEEEIEIWSLLDAISCKIGSGLSISISSYDSGNYGSPGGGGKLQNRRGGCFQVFPKRNTDTTSKGREERRNKKRVWYTPTSMSAQPTDQNQAYATCNTGDRTSCANAAAAAAADTDPEEGDRGGGGGGGCVM